MRHLFVHDKLPIHAKPIYDMGHGIAITLIDNEPIVYRNTDRIELQMYPNGLTDEQINKCLAFAKTNNLPYYGTKPEHFGVIATNVDGAEGLFFFVREITR